MSSLSASPSSTPKHSLSSRSAALLHSTRLGLLSALTGATMMLGQADAQAQIQELGTLPDQDRSVWLLRDMGQQIVRRNHNYPYQQHFTIFKINNPDNWRQNPTHIFGTANDEIIVDNIGSNPSSIENTTVEGRQARKIIHDKLPEGKYALQTVLRASSPTDPNYPMTRETVLLVHVDADGNQEVFKIESPLGVYDPDPDHIDRYWGNRPGAGDAANIEFDNLGNSVIQVSIRVPEVADHANGQISLDMDELEQSGALVKLEFNDGSVITKSAQDLEYDLDTHKIITQVTQNSGQYITKVSFQHDAVPPINVSGPLGVNSLIAQSIKVYPNPVSQGQALNLQLPEGIRYLQIPFAIYDMNGRELLRDILDESQAIAPMLSTGVYILQLEIEGARYTQKFVVK